PPKPRVISFLSASLARGGKAELTLERDVARRQPRGRDAREILRVRMRLTGSCDSLRQRRSPSVSEPIMAPRPNWKGYLKLSLVSCPVALYPAVSSAERVSFNQINKNTGNRIRYKKVDGETGEEVESQ